MLNDFSMMADWWLVMVYDGEWWLNNADERDGTIW